MSSQTQSHVILVCLRRTCRLVNAKSNYYDVLVLRGEWIPFTFIQETFFAANLCQANRSRSSSEAVDLRSILKHLKHLNCFEDISNVFLAPGIL